MNQAKVVVYGTQWCGDCHAATKFLDQHHVSYEWVDISNNLQARKYVKQVNNGMQSVPTIVFQDGSLLVEPSSSKLLEKLRALSLVG
mgnify:FL=1